jgi:predicted amidohydrolase YtcJ
MRRISSLLIFAVCVAAGMGRAQSQTAVVRAALMVDAESGRIVPNPVIVIEKVRIRSVGGEARAGAAQLDLGDVTLLPGFVDMHTHLTTDIEGDLVNREIKETMADAALRGVRAHPGAPEAERLGQQGSCETWNGNWRSEAWSCHQTRPGWGSQPVLL